MKVRSLVFVIFALAGSAFAKSPDNPNVGIPKFLMKELSQIEAKYQGLKCADECRADVQTLWGQYKELYTGAAWHEPSLVTSKTKTIVLFHSYTMSIRDFDDGVISKMRGEGYRIILPSLEGHGDRSRVADLRDVEAKHWIRDADFAVRVAELLSEEVVVGGYSLGGLIATHRVMHKQGKIKALLLFAPALYLNIPFARLSCLGRWLIEKEWVQKIGNVSNYERSFVSGSCAIRNLVDQVIPPMTERLDGVDYTFQKDVNYDWYSHLTYALGRIKVPTFVAIAAEDEVVDNSIVEWLVKSNPKVRTLPTTSARGIHGHLSIMWQSYKNEAGQPTTVGLDALHFIKSTLPAE
jgi:pimeloyl-ACP methyl ester carboxylesterase